MLHTKFSVRGSSTYGEIRTHTRCPQHLRSGDQPKRLEPELSQQCYDAI